MLLFIEHNVIRINQGKGGQNILSRRHGGIVKADAPGFDQWSNGDIKRVGAIQADRPGDVDQLEQIRLHSDRRNTRMAIYAH